MSRKEMVELYKKSENNPYFIKVVSGLVARECDLKGFFCQRLDRVKAYLKVKGTSNEKLNGLILKHYARFYGGLLG